VPIRVVSETSWKTSAPQSQRSRSHEPENRRPNRAQGSGAGLGDGGAGEALGAPAPGRGSSRPTRANHAAQDGHAEGSPGKVSAGGEPRIDGVQDFGRSFFPDKSGHMDYRPRGELTGDGR
jgi:hypothetical protein